MDDLVKSIMPREKEEIEDIKNTITLLEKYAPTADVIYWLQGVRTGLNIYLKDD